MQSTPPQISGTIPFTAIAGSTSQSQLPTSALGADSTAVHHQQQQQQTAPVAPVSSSPPLIGATLDPNIPDATQSFAPAVVASTTTSGGPAPTTPPHMGHHLSQHHQMAPSSGQSIRPNRSQDQGECLTNIWGILMRVPLEATSPSTTPQVQPASASSLNTKPMQSLMSSQTTATAASAGAAGASSSSSTPVAGVAAAGQPLPPAAVQDTTTTASSNNTAGGDAATSAILPAPAGSNDTGSVALGNDASTSNSLPSPAVAGNNNNNGDNSIAVPDSSDSNSSSSPLTGSTPAPAPPPATPPDAATSGPSNLMNVTVVSPTVSLDPVSPVGSPCIWANVAVPPFCLEDTTAVHQYAIHKVHKVNPKMLCRHFHATGTCPKGQRCDDLHVDRFYMKNIVESIRYKPETKKATANNCCSFCGCVFSRALLGGNLFHSLKNASNSWQLSTIAPVYVPELQFAVVPERISFTRGYLKSVRNLPVNNQANDRHNPVPLCQAHVSPNGCPNGKECQNLHVCRTLVNNIAKLQGGLQPPAPTPRQQQQQHHHQQQQQQHQHQHQQTPTTAAQQLHFVPAPIQGAISGNSTPILHGYPITALHGVPQ